jgi:hypothetical protein
VEDVMDGVSYGSEFEWHKAGVAIFGTEDRSRWAFQCPMCGRKQVMDEFKEFKNRGAKPSSFSNECLGRYTGGKNGPHKCDWAAYGMFRGPSFVAVEKDGKEEKIPVFDFWRGD